MCCRAETPADEPFVRQLVLDTIAGELGADAWPEPLRGSILGLQYDTRRAAARAASGDIASQIIVADGEDAGWLLTADLADAIRIVEIMILPKRRGRGLGSTVIGSVLDRAARDGKAVRLVVSCTNARAIRLYERLGFRTIGSDTVQQEMEWAP
jgi:ribosomal protein S18 acetylase RimI-like enzyme